MKKGVLLIIVAAVVAIEVISAMAALFFEDEHAARGRKLFAYYCAHCHGDR